MSKLRLIPAGAAWLCTAGWGLLAVASYPIIVIADSDLGTSAMERVSDCSTMSLRSLAAAAVASGIVPWPRLRIGLALVVLAVIASFSFQSDSFPHAARWPLMAVLGLAMVAASAEARQLHGRPLAPLSVAGLSVLLPTLVVLADWQGRICLGRMPSGKVAKSAAMEGARRSVGLLDGGEAARAESAHSRLRAVGHKNGTLTVEGLNGGPALHLPPAEREHMLQVLTFSPDGRTLAVADNHCMYEGSVISVWDVTPGDGRTPPSVLPRHTLRGHTHWTFSVDFFPDGRTLVSANGDKTVRIWDVVSGHELARFTPHHDPKRDWDIGVDCVAVAPDGRAFATWALDGIKLWDRESLRLVRRLDVRGGLGCWLSFTPDGRYLVAADREAVYRWDLRPSWLPFLGLLAFTSVVVAWLLRANGLRSLPLRVVHWGSYRPPLSPGLGVHDP
jgi:hypothetical protein